MNNAYTHPPQPTVPYRTVNTYYYFTTPHTHTAYGTIPYGKYILLFYFTKKKIKV